MDIRSSHLTQSPDPVLVSQELNAFTPTYGKEKHILNQQATQTIAINTHAPHSLSPPAMTMHSPGSTITPYYSRATLKGHKLFYTPSPPLYIHYTPRGAAICP